MAAPANKGPAATSASVAAGRERWRDRGERQCAGHQDGCGWTCDCRTHLSLSDDGAGRWFGETAKPNDSRIHLVNAIRRDKLREVASNG